MNKESYLYKFLFTNHDYIDRCFASKKYKFDSRNLSWENKALKVIVHELKRFCLSFDCDKNGRYGLEIYIEIREDGKKKVASIKYNNTIFYGHSNGCYIDAMPTNFIRIIENKGSVKKREFLKQTAYLFSVLLYGYSKENILTYPLDETFLSPNELCDKLFGFSRFPNIGKRTTKVDLYNSNNTELQLKYIFGLDNKSDNKQVLEAQKMWYKQNIEFSLDKLEQTASSLFDSAKHFPIFNHLFDEPYKNQQIIRTLLSLTVRKNGENIILNSPLTNLINWSNEIVSNYMKHTEDSFETIVKKIAACNDDLLFEHLEDIFEKDNDKYKFKDDCFKLLFNAKYISQGINETNDGSSNDDIKKAIWEYLPKESLKKDILENVLIEDEYDQFLFFSTVLLLSVDSYKRNSFIWSLIENEAVNFDVQEYEKNQPINRIKQIASIYLITNLLIENISLPDKLRAEMFKATYGRTMYSLQSDYLVALLNCSKFYTSEIERNIKSVFEFNEGKAINQPYYLFLFGYYFYEYFQNKEYFFNELDGYQQNETFKEAAIIQYLSWSYDGSVEINKTIEIILRGFKILSEKLFSVVGDINENPDGYKEFLEDFPSHTKKVMYGWAICGQLLCYALANYINKFNPDLDKSKIQENKKNLFYVCVYSDYFIRKTNTNYVSADNVDDHKNLYLPCGSSRLICAIDHLLFARTNSIFNIEKCVVINNIMYNDYNRWIQFEKSRDSNIRYLILLLKTLSKTNYIGAENDGSGFKEGCEFTSEIKYAKTILSDNKCKFLPYDHIN